MRSSEIVRGGNLGAEYPDCSNLHLGDPQSTNYNNSITTPYNIYGKLDIPIQTCNDINVVENWFQCQQYLTYIILKYCITQFTHKAKKKIPDCVSIMVTRWRQKKVG